MPAVAPNVLFIISRAPPPIVGPDVQLNKHLGRKKPALACRDVHVSGRWSDPAIANILNLYES